MKNFKIVLGSLLIAALFVGFSSFALKSYNPKAFAQVCYLYGGVQPVTTSSIDDTGNWTLTTSITTLCTGGTLLCGICYDNTVYSSLQAALDQAKIDYFANHPTQGQTINGITYYKKSS